MATPCISAPKLNIPVHTNVVPRVNSTVIENRMNYCSTRHVDGDNSTLCRFSYATWCPVCEDQTRSKSAGTTMHTSAYHSKTTNYFSEVGCKKEQTCYKKNSEQSESSTMLEHPNKQLPVASGNGQASTGCRSIKRVNPRPCENHIEPNSVSNHSWNSDLNCEWKFRCKRDNWMSLHDRYYYEVEMLRSKLNRLRERSVDEKIVDRCCGANPHISCLPDTGFKRPRDKSPSGYKPRKLLPVVPTTNAPLQTKEYSVLFSSSSATSISSDSDHNYSGYDEEDLHSDEDKFEEEDRCLFSPPKVLGIASNSLSRPLTSLSNKYPVDAIVTAPTGQVHPGLRASLFPYVPPYIRFSTHDNKAEELPASIQKLLKWKLSTITPIVVRRTVVNSNFKLVRRSNEWGGTWGKHMKSLCFKTLREYQKINHFPGTFQIGRKDRLWKNLYRLMSKFGKKEFGFIPRTYVLPQDTKCLRSAWEKNCGKERWIVKPPASARGTGIRVIHKWTQIPKKCPLVVQKYISDPYLINGSKFDLRLYVLVTSIDPLRIYMYDNGLVRFASVKYSNEMTSLTDRYMHLTNYSINKLSSQYTQNEDASACQGHKWSLQALWTYLEKERSVDVSALQEKVIDLVIKTVISGESAISTMSQANLASRYCSYELFGVDVLLDTNLKPWLLEVNISPSLHSSSPLDLAVKGPMVRDLMNIAGYQIPNKLSPQAQSDLAESMGLNSKLCFDRRLYTTALSNEERQKHTTFKEVGDREDYLDNILQDLTPDDVRHLIAYEDELTQLGNFQKVFPTRETYAYHQFLEAPRYYNMLFDAWEMRQSKDRTAGIHLLETLCQKQVHLDTTSIPPKRTKVSTSLNSSECSNSEFGPREGSANSTDDVMRPTNLKEKWTVTVACDTICRAVRPRSRKPGLITKPYPRSAYIARRTVKSAQVS